MSVLFGDIFRIINIASRNFIDGIKSVLDFYLCKKHISEPRESAERTDEPQDKTEQDGEKFAPKVTFAFRFVFVIFFVVCHKSVTSLSDD